MQIGLVNWRGTAAIYSGWYVHILDMVGTEEIVIGRKGWDCVLIGPVESNVESEIAADVEIRCDVWSGKLRAEFRKTELARFAGDTGRLHRDLNRTGRTTFCRTEHDP